MITILQGDVIEQLRTLPSESVHCCVTSPPYWGLRDYSTNGQLGIEKTPEEYVAKMVDVFREVRRVLRKDGTLWLNLGDSFNGLKVGSTQENVGARRHNTDTFRKEMWTALKPKDLCGIPWRVAFALQADGWWLRSDIIWAKPNPMPESVTDRPTKAHEYLFLLTKSANYFYDAEAIKEQTSPFSDFGNPIPAIPCPSVAGDSINGREIHKRLGHGSVGNPSGRNKRSVWTVATAPYREAHFATYPPDLIKPCILAGTSAKGCCAKCGSPWERITENKPMVIDRSTRTHSTGQSGTMLEPAESKTIGWQPTCKCYTHDEKQAIIHSDSIEAWFGSEPSGIVPCTVLDPFAGSGTTGAVALELGRKAILIELNPKYVELIDRLAVFAFHRSLVRDPFNGERHVAPVQVAGSDKV